MADFHIAYVGVVGGCSRLKGGEEKEREKRDGKSVKSLLLPVLSTIDGMDDGPFLRGLPYTTPLSLNFWELVIPFPRLCAKCVLLVRKFGVFLDPLLPLLFGRRTWRPPNALPLPSFLLRG